MTQKQIKVARIKIEEKITKLKGLIKIESAKLSVLIERCSHPKDRVYYSYGESGMYCPDCGRQT